MYIKTITGELPVSEEELIKHIEKSIGDETNRHSKQVLVNSGLIQLGINLGYKSKPECPVTVASMRSGKGYIDVVWLQNGLIKYAFETVTDCGGPRDIAKLATCENGFLIQIGRSSELKLLNVMKAERLLRIPPGTLQKKFWSIPGIANS